MGSEIAYHQESICPVLMAMKMDIRGAIPSSIYSFRHWVQLISFPWKPTSYVWGIMGKEFLRYWGGSLCFDQRKKWAMAHSHKLLLPTLGRRRARRGQTEGIGICDLLIYKFLCFAHRDEHCGLLKYMPTFFTYGGEHRQFAAICSWRRAAAICWWITVIYVTAMV